MHLSISFLSFEKKQTYKGLADSQLYLFFTRIQASTKTSKKQIIQSKMQFTLATIATIAVVAASSSSVQIRGAAHAIDQGFVTPLPVKGSYNETDVTFAVIGSSTPADFFVGSDGLIADPTYGYLDVISSGKFAGFLCFNKTQSNTDIQIRQPGPLPGNYWECPGAIPSRPSQNAIISANASPTGCFSVDLTVSATWSTTSIPTPTSTTYSNSTTSSTTTPPPISTSTGFTNSTTLITTTVPAITSYTTYCPLPTVITITTCSENSCSPVPVTVTTATTVTCQSCVAPASTTPTTPTSAPTSAPTAPIVNGANVLERGIVGAAGAAAIAVMML